MDEYESLSHTKWDCKYHVIFIPKCRRRTIYFVSTVGRDQEQIRGYIKKQEAEDTRLEQLNLWR
jgi:putative transposase